MKEYTLTLKPSNKYYPTFTHTGTDSVVDVSKLYKDTYQLHVDSDWYVPYEEKYIHTRQLEKVIKLKVGTSRYRFTYSTVGKPSKTLGKQPTDAPATLWIDGEEYQFDTAFELPYKDGQYHIKVEKDHYHTHEMKVDSINDNAFTRVDEHRITLERKTGTWVSKRETSVIPFDVEIIEDDGLLPEDSYIQQSGMNGSLTASWEVEMIDGKPTNAETPRIETVTTPPRKEIKVQGTMTSEWRRELVLSKPIPYQREVIQDRNVLPENSYIRTQGKEGEERWYQNVEYKNGKKTGNVYPVFDEGEEYNYELPHGSQFFFNYLSDGTYLINTYGNVPKEFVEKMLIAESIQIGGDLVVGSGWQQAGDVFRLTSPRQATVYSNLPRTFTGGTQIKITVAETNMSNLPEFYEYIAPINEVYVQGTLSSEWRREVYRTETIPITTRYIYTANLFENEEEIRDYGLSGIRTYYREYEYRNGVKTSAWRNETNAITRTMQQRVVARGTKKREIVVEKTIPSYHLFEAQGAPPNCYLRVGGYFYDNFKEVPFDKVTEIALTTDAIGAENYTYFLKGSWRISGNYIISNHYVGLNYSQIYSQVSNDSLVDVSYNFYVGRKVRITYTP